MDNEGHFQSQRDFLAAIANSLKVLRQGLAGQTHSIHLLDAHVQPSGIESRYIESDHCSPCFTLPVTLEELHFAQELPIPQDFKVGIAAYVAVMATGGVEWNTITILKLQIHSGLILSRFKPDLATGDLNRVALQNGIPIFCNFGCDGNSTISLAVLIIRLDPSIFWICNWSVQDESEKDDYHKLGEKVFIVDQRSYDTKEGWIQTIDRSTNKYVHHFVATNGLIQKEIASRIGKQSEQKVSTIRPVLRSIPIFSKSKPTRKDIYQISRLSAQKRLDRGLRMSGWLSEYGYLDTWNIVGDGPLRKDLEVASFRNPLVSFHGFKPTLEVINQVYGFVQSSDFEGLPMVVIEALAAGVPVFATKTGDLPWLSEQLSSIDCNLLTLSEFSDEHELKENFLNWRRNLEAIWASPSRKHVSSEVSKLFNPVSASKSYVEVFSKGAFN